MNTQSLKFRLVAWYAGVLTALFLIFGVFVYQSLAFYFKQTLREALARRTRQVADLVVRLSPLDPEQLSIEIRNRFAPEANNRFTRITLNGKRIYISGTPADETFDPLAVPPPAPKEDEAFLEKRLLASGATLYVEVLSRKTKFGDLLVEEGSLEDRIEAILRRWLLVLTVGLVFLIFLAVLGGYTLVNRALHPVDRIIESARRISSTNLTERLPVIHTGDELDRLSTALNSMIQRLDDSFQHTKRFLADASHELRTPMTMLQAELEAILDKSGDRPALRDLASSALEEVERLRKIVEGLFALSRLEAGEAMEQFLPFDLGQLAAATTEQICLLAEDRNIHIKCQTESNVIVQGDPSRLKQVLVNLLDNALKYTPSGGHTSVHVAIRNGKALLEVIDDGIGIPHAALPHVFERFFRVDKARSREMGGAGLGLAIVKSICAAHSGSIEVQSKPGEGTRFVVQLPLATKVHAQPQSAPST